ncbi:uncharacterized protein METZ01_LOCUS9677 [marine metagenome]|uniref:Uncharacterized protein n=1 Tax=marine metagenome TaxID=408172 RepID=A0A381NTL0_9ZZZZ
MNMDDTTGIHDVLLQTGRWAMMT